MPFVVNSGTYCLATEASSARAPSWEMSLQILVVCRSMVLLVPYLTCNCFCRYRGTKPLKRAVTAELDIHKKPQVCTQARVLAQEFQARIVQHMEKEIVFESCVCGCFYSSAQCTSQQQISKLKFFVLRHQNPPETMPKSFLEWPKHFIKMI